MLSKIKLNTIKDKLVFALGVLSVIYLLNPTAGFFEFIPDNAPIIGNLDEAGATMLLLKVLSYFGYSFSNFFKK
jgi:Protein of unknown function (DUF1232)